MNCIQKPCLAVYHLLSECHILKSLFLVISGFSQNFQPQFSKDLHQVPQEGEIFFLTDYGRIFNVTLYFQSQIHVLYSSVKVRLRDKKSQYANKRRIKVLF